MFSLIKKLTPRDQDYPERYYPLFIYKRILDGTLYDCFQYQYHDEYVGPEVSPTYISEDKRAPCINTGLNLCRTTVEQSVSFLWGEDRFPEFLVDDVATKQWLDNIAKDTHLVRVMQDAVTKGSIGSVAIHLRVLQDRFFPTVMETLYLTPTFDPQAPDTLIKMTEKKKVKGKDLKAAGYIMPDEALDQNFWFHREWDSQEEIWYVPYKVGEEKLEKFRLKRDDKRSVTHNLGLVPWIWIRNLVGTDNNLNDNVVDGQCTFEPAIESCVQIDYALSRADRAMKYNADPLTVFKVRSPGQLADFVRTSGNAIVVGVEGDAKVLEVSGDAAHAILDTVEELKDQALHAIGGSRADPDKLATSQSSVAQRMLYLPMVQLASHLRVSYGQCGLLPLLKMMMEIANVMPIKVLGKYPAKPDQSQDIQLAWGDFFPPTPFDQQQMSQTMMTLVQAGILSKRTALENMRKYLDLGDLDEEIAQIGKEQDEMDQRTIQVEKSTQPLKPTVVNKSP